MFTELWSEHFRERPLGSPGHRLQDIINISTYQENCKVLDRIPLTQNMIQLQTSRKMLKNLQVS